MEQVGQWLLNYLSTNGYMALFTGMLLTGMSLPLPSELTLGFAGYMVYNGQLHLFKVVLVAALGELAGSLVSYGIGFYSEMALKNKYMRRLMPSEKRISDVARWFNRRGMLAVFAARLVPVVRGAIPIPAGLLRINLAKFVLCMGLSSAVWCLALTSLGIRMGQSWRRIYEIEQSLEVPIAILSVTGVILLILCRKFYSRRSK